MFWLFTSSSTASYLNLFFGIIQLYPTNSDHIFLYRRTVAEKERGISYSGTVYNLEISQIRARGLDIT
jgi:hypothetical protein